MADVPDNLKGKALAEIWSRLHNKFRIAKYSQLPRTRLADAIVYITQMDLKCASRSDMVRTDTPIPQRQKNAIKQGAQDKNGWCKDMKQKKKPP